MKIRTDQPLLKDRDKITRQIAAFWNQISEGWRRVWGQHIHHGYYEGGSEEKQQDARQRRYIRLVADPHPFADTDSRI